MEKFSLLRTFLKEEPNEHPGVQGSRHPLPVAPSARSQLAGSPARTSGDTLQGSTVLPVRGEQGCRPTQYLLRWPQLASFCGVELAGT